MIDRTRAVMLLILCSVVAACGVALIATLAHAHIADLSSRIAQYEKRITAAKAAQTGDPAQLDSSPESFSEQLAARTAELEKEQARFYRPDEVSLFEFSSRIQQRLKQAGLTVTRYRPVEETGGTDKKGRAVELVVHGPASALLTFLKETAEAPKHEPIRNIAIHRRGTTDLVDVTFRIGYEEITMDSAQ